MKQKLWKNNKRRSNFTHFFESITTEENTKILLTIFFRMGWNSVTICPSDSFNIEFFINIIFPNDFIKQIQDRNENVSDIYYNILPNSTFSPVNTLSILSRVDAI